MVNQTPARAAALAIVSDLQGRKGLGDEWDWIDEDVQAEIVETWTDLIERETWGDQYVAETTWPATPLGALRALTRAAEETVTEGSPTGSLLSALVPAQVVLQQRNQEVSGG